MDLALYRELHAQARRVSRRADEAEDLVQEALLAALEAGRAEPEWLAGVIRNQAAMAARGAARRHSRETAIATEDVAHPAMPAAPDSKPLLQRLPPAARRVAVLALHGLSAEEIRWILQLTPAAFRQRLTSIRKTLGALPPEQRAESLALAYVRDPARTAELQFGLVRRALKSAFRGGDGLGTHDPDGHLLVIRGGAHVSPPGGNG
ncbi:sigma-70 family RNA polymerase sigma factor [Luteimonas sp. SX5]|uniref:Sigma-70 family RNA polymerase sigma factor n=1 Tax=Luteimonas galliterrae TaxID=2940486 RepID=A0ABT0ML43_9GAMM|nr:sigma-70 family RNA polymerase sigma factor [Luteimonas galliterrae]MCL1635585.1 sigma-70 family RNA polymerase sigma factor [Luteimonas galliterrae]